MAMSALEVWRMIPQTPEVVGFFTGIFDVIGVTIAETGEELTVAIEGDAIRIDPGLPEKPDFVVPIAWQNVENMVAHADDGMIDPREAWRIVSVLFTSLTQATLRNPIMSNNMMRRVAGVEDIAHVYLIAPDGKEANCHTLIYVKGQWLVISGLYGEPKRTFRMTAEDSIEYQRKVFSAIKKNTMIEWFRFSSWYKKWRKGVSIRN
ncbi:MAG TPA: hypothetical protein QF641_00665 [Candidatus Thalassarchaeaceae archaeon]|jgi:hypothetical protein|nr:hypothetical protein [Candidatus Thalassarchaeaceae archaeon]|tara:strand:+ start:10700 stop:11317 length:618 start_codon:yes stop_codon:yes gene_type:complete